MLNFSQFFHLVPAGQSFAVTNGADSAVCRVLRQWLVAALTSRPPRRHLQAHLRLRGMAWGWLGVRLLREHLRCEAAERGWR